jgi:hypothetical protein
MKSKCTCLHPQAYDHMTTMDELEQLTSTLMFQCDSCWVSHWYNVFVVVIVELSFLTVIFVVSYDAHAWDDKRQMMHMFETTNIKWRTCLRRQTPFQFDVKLIGGVNSLHNHLWLNYYVTNRTTERIASTLWNLKKNLGGYDSIYIWITLFVLLHMHDCIILLRGDVWINKTSLTSITDQLYIKLKWSLNVHASISKLMTIWQPWMMI